MTNDSLIGQVALVTGASRGFGRAIAGELVATGMRVALTSRSITATDTWLADLTQASSGEQPLVLAGDAQEPGDVATIVAGVERHWGRIDLLINNAGRVEERESRLWECDPTEWWGVISTNLRSAALFSRFAVPGMVRRGAGRVVNINSLRGVRGSPTQTSYGVSKAALSALTKSLADGLRDTGVHVFDYSPGRLQTDLARTLVAQGSMPDGSWTPMSQAIAGLVAIAAGTVDSLTGCFFHAEDDLSWLVSHAHEMSRSGGRQLTLHEAFPGDPLTTRQVGK